MNEPLLRITGLTKRFGGVIANRGIDLEVAHGETHAIIGPNGAGKTTLVAQLAGELIPSAGTIVFDGVDITTMPPYRRSACGLARIFQITSIFKNFSTLENVALAAQAHAGHSFSFWQPARRDEALNALARESLARVGLESRLHEPCMNLSHGEHRQLEIAMAFVARPRLVLLDEPTAGMGPEESKQVLALLQSLKRDHAMLLIEHDMEVVFAIADRVTVLVDGQVIASGAPEAIQADPLVRKAYLGDAGDAGAAAAAN